MRLLERNNTGEICLREFFGDDAPQYAILSHTWGTEEVSFIDLMDGSGENKLGYRKIRFCGDQAQRDGLRYFWVDTCCIDKSSSAELQEAINCMFRWYRDAARCYVYLSDVSRPARDADDETSRVAWESAFRNSRWFTRGWTLQELIAPASVEFFSKEGVHLGNRISLEEHIHDVTRIPTEALRGSPLSNFSIPERMAWVEGRETTRKEDKAYSLLGIFDVQIPLLYGEGGERAFKRLVKEVNKAAKGEGRSITTAVSTLRCSWDLAFMSRQENLDLDDENKADFEKVCAELEYDLDEYPIMDVFQNILQEWNPEAQRATELTAFCRDIRFNDLQSGFGEIRGPVALVIDRNKVGSNIPCARPLTDRELFEELQRPRFPSDEPGADLRLIFVTDPNARSLSVLAATASTMQATFLIDFMSNHLEFRPSLDVNIPDKRPKTFGLEFQVPFFVWRESPVHLPAVDKRCIDGHPLRSTQILSFLTPYTPGAPGAPPELTIDYLHEAKYSCLVSGLDNERWIVYGFIDNYFEGTANRETISTYVEDWEEGFYGDPLIRGQDALNKPVWCPRHYFLRVLEVRIGMVRDEWAIVSIRMKKRVNHSKRVFLPDGGGLSRDSFTVADLQGQLERIDAWHDLTRQLLERLIHVLGETIQTWEDFDAKSGQYFWKLDGVTNVSENAKRCLGAIENSFLNLRKTRKELDHLRVMFYDDCKAASNMLKQRIDFRLAQGRRSSVTLERLFIFILTLLTVGAALGSIMTSYMVLSFTILTVAALVTISWGALRNWHWYQLSRYIRWNLARIMPSRDQAIDFEALPLV